MLLLAASVHANDDPVGAYLDRLELHDLLIVHLEEQLGRARDEERESIILDLADLYTGLLATEPDAARRADLESRSRDLLELAPADSAATLRLTLLRSAFQNAERIAENHRLRLAQEDEIQQAIDQCDELVHELESLEDMIARQLHVIGRRGGREDDWSRQRTAELQQLELQTRFYRAWSKYYGAYLRSDRDGAERAERVFSRLLRTESEYPHPREVSVDLRAQEPYARAILGMALSRSMTASYATAAEWLTLIEHRSAHRTVREEAPGWQLVLALEHGQFGRARAILNERETEGAEIPLTWLRLAAVHALEATQPGRDVDDLAVFAVTRMAARGELQQVLTLAETYGVESMGSNGFAVRYILGMTLYRKAREAHDDADVAEDASVRAMYADAARQLQQALQEHDVDSFSEAAASCRSMIGWCRLYVGAFAEAADWFEQAHAGLTGERSEEALWMAIVSVDRSLRMHADEALQKRRDALVDSFLELKPDGSRAAQLRIRRALEGERLSEAKIQELLGISLEDDRDGRARRAAAQGLYELYRGAHGDERARRGRAFLDVADDLLARHEAFGDLRDEAHTRRLLMLSRQVLEVALHRELQARRSAQRAINMIDTLNAEGVITLDDVRDELTYRRLGFALLHHGRDQAASYADALWARDSSSIWARQAARTMFQDAHTQWQAATAQTTMRDDELQAVLVEITNYGGHVLREFEDDPDWMHQPHLVQAHAIVAEALMKLWEMHGESARGRAALFLYERLLEHQPRNASFLRAHARLAEHFGHNEAALRSWRALATGTQRGEPGWYEARYHVVINLAAVNPDRAREVLSQHRQLEPSYGPEPWGEKFADLARLLHEDATDDDETSS